jgi:hypothetical protein
MIKSLFMYDLQNDCCWIQGMKISFTFLQEKKSSVLMYIW